MFWHRNDIGIFLVMADTAEARRVQDEAAIIFDHQTAQNIEGASVFWIRQLAALGREDEALAHWQTKRDHTRRGIVEVISQVENNAQNYRLSAGGYLAEIDRMNLEVREYLSLQPNERQKQGA